ncbi:MAG TPA: hypothetical protein VMB47_17710 [Candidatus Aquilonibacter sp.]|nr:hypothetical protein [Candidatus Aquilonibacter sp.]
MELGETAKGLQNTRDGLDITLALYRADPAENGHKLPNLADAYAAAGFAYARLATQLRVDAAGKVKYWKEARDEYQDSTDTWREVQRAHPLLAGDAKSAASAAQGLQDADAALAKLSGR